MDLSGTWRAALADDELRRSAVGLHFDDSDWERIDVPGHWRSAPAFADTDGPLLYRTGFELDPVPGERQWVVFDGVFYQADVWLDGAYLGDPEGYFAPHVFDITALAALSREHSLAVELSCSPQRDQRNKRSLTGVFQHSDYIDPFWNPGGIWRPVRIETTGPVRIQTLRVLCLDATPERANLHFTVTLDSDEARRVSVRSEIGDRKARVRDHSLAKGSNELTWTIGFDRPDLWWPWALGEQPLIDMSVMVSIDGEPSHRRTLRTGVRQIDQRDWITTVNGERLFLKGANIAPTKRELGEATPEAIRRDVEAARDAGLDLIRVNAHIARPELYHAADELGVLVWQDLPLQWGYARQIGKQAVRQATAAVDLLGHHPSIAMWCGHNEPFRIRQPRDKPFDIANYTAQFAKAQQLPSWNRSLLDRRIKRALEKADGSRPVVAHSGVLPHLPQLDGTDSHLYLGWYAGRAEDLAGLAATMPRLVRFVGEFGTQSVPETADWMQPERWPHLDWVSIEQTTGMQRQLFDRHVPPAAHRSFADWREATQQYQADVLRRFIETLRRLKYSPTGGFALVQLADCQPGVSWGLLDHERVPKPAFRVVADACRPVIVVADAFPATMQPGAPIALDLHLVNDLRTDVDDAVVSAVLTWGSGRHEWRFTGNAPADSVVLIGTLQIVVPTAPGAMTLDISVESPTAVASNRYETEIARR